MSQFSTQYRDTTQSKLHNYKFALLTVSSPPEGAAEPMHKSFIKTPQFRLIAELSVFRLGRKAISSQLRNVLDDNNLFVNRTTHYSVSASSESKIKAYITRTNQQG